MGENSHIGVVGGYLLVVVREGLLASEMEYAMLPADEGLFLCRIVCSEFTLVCPLPLCP